MSYKTPSQQYIPIEQIREGVIVMKDRTLRGTLLISSLNFALKSEDEQMAIIFQFQNFLNSLDFSCQIIVSSRKVNITGYIDKIKGLEEKQKNELLKIQTAEYRAFIEQIVSNGSIMSKNFYIVIPYFPMTELTSMQGVPGQENKTELTEKKFQAGKYQLLQRMEYVSLGIRRCGLKSASLGSEELIELLWGLHHPKQAELGYYPDLPPEVIT
jgi:type IV secretory pathway VirB4 component